MKTVYELDKYNIWTGNSFVTDDRRACPPGFTNIAPPEIIPTGQMAQLRHRTWVLIEEIPESDIERVREDLAERMREIRDLMISRMRWRIERHQDELALGLEPTEDIEPILEYVQALREVPDQEGFPESIEWPYFDEVEQNIIEIELLEITFP